jgi:hypothetical protein
LAYHECDRLLIGGSGYEVHWLPFSVPFYLVDMYRRFRSAYDRYVAREIDNDIHRRAEKMYA